MKRGDKRKIIIQPEIIEQRKVDSKDSAQERRFIAGENTSSFYANVYAAAIRRGKREIPPLRSKKVEDVIISPGVKIIFPWRNRQFPEYQETRDFRPDVIHTRNDGRGYTELKTFSGHNLQAHCSVHQAETYAFALLWRRRHGDETPWVDYAFVKYGDSKMNGQHRHENGSLVEKLADSTQSMVVTPFNLFAFLMMISPEKQFNQANQGRSVERGYRTIRSGLLSPFMEYEPEKACEIAIQNALSVLEARPKRRMYECGWEKPLFDRLSYLNRRKNLGAVIKDLSLDGLSRRDEVSPKMKTYAGSKVKQFPITTFRIPSADYQNWLNRLTDKTSRDRIFRRVGITDLYGKLEKHEEKYGETVDFSGQTRYLIRPQDGMSEGVPF